MEIEENITSFGLDLPESSRQKLLDILVKKEHYADDVLIKIGEKPTKIYFIEQGIIGSYYFDEKGKMLNKYLFLSSSLVTSLTGIIKNQTSSFTFTCVTDCVLYEFDIDKFMELIKSDIHILTLYSRALEKSFAQLEERLIDIQTLNATERYLKLKKTIHNVDKLQLQYQIASYLNVTPVQLSRIRKDLKAKQNRLA